MFKVIALMKFGIDDTYDAEYSGIDHETKEAAEKELQEAKKKTKNDATILNVYIREV